MIGIGAVGYLIVFATALFRIVHYQGFETLMLLCFWMVWTFVGSAIGVLSVFAARLKGRPPHPLAKRGVKWGLWAAVAMLVLGFGH